MQEGSEDFGHRVVRGEIKLVWTIPSRKMSLKVYYSPLCDFMFPGVVHMFAI